MILSFSITCKLARERGVSDPLRSGIKTVSRRDWSDRTAQAWINAYERGNLIHQAWSAAPFVKGARKLGTIRLTCAPYQEALVDMPETDVLREGGFWATKQAYIDDIGGGDHLKVLWVVRWDNFTI